MQPIKSQFTVTNFPDDECDILVEHKGLIIIGVTDCEGKTLDLTNEQTAYVQGEITAAQDAA